MAGLDGVRGLIDGPIVVVGYEELVAHRFRHGVSAFVLTVALVVPVTIVVAAVFETPFRGLRSWVPA